MEGVTLANVDIHDLAATVLSRRTGLPVSRFELASSIFKNINNKYANLNRVQDSTKLQKTEPIQSENLKDFSESIPEKSDIQYAKASSSEKSEISGGIAEHTNQGDADSKPILDTGEYEILQRTTEDGRVIATGIVPDTYEGAVTIPEGITHIDDHAFDKAKFRRLVMPESVVYVGDYAFANSEVEEIVLSKNVTAIPHGMCSRCKNLRQINLENIQSIGNFSFNESALASVHIVKPIIQVGKSAFSRCLNLMEFSHPGTLRKIREEAFAFCNELVSFDFNGVAEIETKAFYQSGLSSIILSNEVKAIQASTFVSPNLMQVVIGGDSLYKIAEYGFSNPKGFPITYTFDTTSVSNFGTHLFTSKDTVKCYHNTVVESAARLAGSTIEYLDGEKPGNRAVVKAGMLGQKIDELLSSIITTAYSDEDIEYNFELNEAGLLNIPLSDEHLSYLQIASTPEPDNYTERATFKVLLDHLRKVSKPNGCGLSSKMLACKDTVSVKRHDIYDDGTSRVYEFKMTDHKFESKTAIYIVAITGNRVRYCCLANQYTDIYCQSIRNKDLSKLLRLLTPGDSLGQSCVINGVRYANIVGQMDKKDKYGIRLKGNLFQAVFHCSIAVRLEKNYVALILPVNGKVIKVASLGKAVWANENEEAYKMKSCTIEDIQDYEGNTIIPTTGKTKEFYLFNEINALSPTDIQNRIEDYSHIKEANLSQYVTFRNFCLQYNVESLEDLGEYGIQEILRLPIIEKRTMEWFNSAVGKTIVEAARADIEFTDGSYIHQYKTVKRVALKNKLMTGGDRTVYVFEAYDSFGNLFGIYVSTLDFETLFKVSRAMCITSDKPSKVYQTPGKFDVVDQSDLVVVCEAFSSSRGQEEKNPYTVHLAVYKPNGLYYLCYFGSYGRLNNSAALLIQVGDFEVVMDYIDCSNTISASGRQMLMEAGHLALYAAQRPLPSRYALKGSYAKLLALHDLAIQRVTDITEYLKTGIPPVICHMFGVNNLGDKIYELPTFSDTPEIEYDESGMDEYFSDEYDEDGEYFVDE